MGKSEIQKNEPFVSVGVFAYNEENLIGSMLTSLTKQEDFDLLVKEVLVISSGSTDGTNKIASGFVSDNPKVILHAQSIRTGKASAINEFLKLAKGQIVALTNADNILTPTCLKDLVQPFENDSVGMTGGHPIPVNEGNKIAERASRWLWRLHHEIALISPKLGEIIAFRAKIIDNIDADTSVDEATIEYTVLQNGLRMVYVPDAIVYNCGPKTVADFIKQRRRINAGHLELKRKYGYSVSTLSLKRTLQAVLRSGLQYHPIDFLSVVLMEMFARFLGYFDGVCHKKHDVWTVIKSTKSFEDKTKIKNPIQNLSNFKSDSLMQ